MMKDKTGTGETVQLDHGSGGIASNRLVRERITDRLGHISGTAPLEDCAVTDFPNMSKLAFSTDSYVVDPLFFPGGDIGCLAVHGTINDLAMRGAEPVCLSLAFIIEEGLSIYELELIVDSIGRASDKCGVPVVTGDTKVVPGGSCDRIFINTSGAGFLPMERDISSGNARPGDAILISGSCGDHGITIMTARAEMSLTGNIQSDTAPLHDMVKRLLNHIPEDAVHVMRDPTRGGFATALNEIAADSGVSMEIEEAAVPVRQEVRAACEILGLDPLYLANEGKMLLIVEEAHAGKALDIMRSFPHGREAAITGRVTGRDNPGRVTMKTSAGGSRIMAALHGNPLPRIC